MALLIQMRYYLERLFSSYAPGDDIDDDDEDEGRPRLAVRPRPRPAASAPPQPPPENPWLAGRLPDEELAQFFARRSAESAWESAQMFFERWHDRFCQAMGPANVAPYWRKVIDFAKKLEDDEIHDEEFWSR